MQTPKTTFDPQAFLEFCRGKPAGRRYRYMDVGACPITQFGRSVGAISRRQNVFDNAALEGLHDAVWMEICDADSHTEGRCRNCTFGALASRLEAALAEQSGS